ncbi:1-deoxy-D-xylulose-5-phosphate synthase [Planctomycetales bacterium]|nr:1-deoxy-D-xylulose-5-phosphate synthase [Planctomycetales bacterium]
MFGKKPVFKLILPTVESPLELERLSQPELKNLAAEIREEICRLYDYRSVHFASNLGVVELCIALHSVFDFSWDRLMWDTGHQIYPHKLLTGRFNRFHTIRTRGGLSGFPDPQESIYDLFKTGHAGTSVGTALGLCCGDEIIAGSNRRHTVAVIGDGAFGNGNVFEAMNHAGWLKKNIMVILNDNKMSICPRVGGIATQLDRLRLHPLYQRFKQKLHNVVDKIPVFGQSVDSFLGRFKSAVKAGLHGGMLYEEMGFRYIGPIDGHNIPRLQRFLRMARSMEEPVLLHVLTEKGHGYKPAEENPTEYHAPKPGNGKYQGKYHSVAAPHNWDESENDITPAPLMQENSSDSPSVKPDISFTEQVRDTLFSLMLEDKRICVITAAMCQGNMLEQIRDSFPDRFFDVGICESHAVSFAAGLAKAGMLPVVDIYSTFLQRSYDQLFQEISLQDLPVIFTLDRAGLTGPDGPTHHGIFDLSYLRPFPNFTVMVPADKMDVEPMLRFAVNHRHPSALRYPKASAQTMRSTCQKVEFGKSEIVREGREGFLVVCGPFLPLAEDVRRTLMKNIDGLGRLEPGIINVRFVKPLDKDTLLTPLLEGKFLITLEEGMSAGGFGSALLEAANEEGIETRRLRRIAFPDMYIEHGDRNELLEEFGFDVRSIVYECRKCMFG